MHQFNHFDQPRRHFSVVDSAVAAFSTFGSDDARSIISSSSMSSGLFQIDSEAVKNKKEGQRRNRY